MHKIEINNGKKKIVAFTSDAGMKALEDAVDMEIERLGWTIQKSEENEVSKSKIFLSDEMGQWDKNLFKKLKSDPNVSVGMEIIDLSDAPVEKQIPPTPIVEISFMDKMKRAQFDFNRALDKMDSVLLKQAELNQASTAREFPRMNDIYQEEVLKPKNNE